MPGNGFEGRRRLEHFWFEKFESLLTCVRWYACCQVTCHVSFERIDEGGARRGRPAWPASAGAAPPPRLGLIASRRRTPSLPKRFALGVTQRIGLSTQNEELFLIGGVGDSDAISRESATLLGRKWQGVFAQKTPVDTQSKFL